MITYWRGFYLYFYFFLTAYFWEGCLKHALLNIKTSSSHFIIKLFNEGKRAYNGSIEMRSIGSICCIEMRNVNDCYLTTLTVKCKCINDHGQTTWLNKRNFGLVNIIHLRSSVSIISVFYCYHYHYFFWPIASVFCFFLSYVYLI